MMKAIIFLAILIVVCAQETQIQLKCADLVNDNDFCDSTDGFPTKICSFTIPRNVTEFCNRFYLQYWMDLCPKKNVDTQAYCRGKGFVFANISLPFFCGWFPSISCRDDTDCLYVFPPAAPFAPPKYCYECCTECFNETQCNEKVAQPPEFGILYTNSTECTPCRPLSTAPDVVPTPSPAGVAPLLKQPPGNDTPHEVPTDRFTPAAKALNNYQIALVVIIVIFLLLFVALLSVIIMQRKALKRGAGKSKYGLLDISMNDLNDDARIKVY